MFDQFREAMEYEEGARYDDQHERYAATMRDMDIFNAAEDAAREEEYAEWAATPEGQAEIARWEKAKAEREAREREMLNDEIPF